MKILAYMGHPAHFHLLKNTIRGLQKRNHPVQVLIQKRDILEELLARTGLDHINILTSGRKDTKLGIGLGVLKRDFRLFSLCLKKRPDIMIGTSVEIPHVGKILNIPTINLNEDDCRAVPLYCKLSYPLSTVILAPTSCSTGRWEKKTVHHHSYHELAYLHPNHFEPQKEVLQAQVSLNRPYFLIRFAKLSAHHDVGKKGLTTEVAKKIIEKLTAHGQVYISSQRPLEPEFARYRLSINPVDMHHVLYHADMYIGDSQTMTAEAAVLGTPALRFNDFVGQLGYLEELEHRYGLTYGIKTTEPEKLYATIEELLNTPGLKEQWQQRRQKMLQDKIDLTAFLLWFIENYPDSVEMMKKDPTYQYRFK